MSQSRQRSHAIGQSCVSHRAPCLLPWQSEAWITSGTPCPPTGADGEVDVLQPDSGGSSPSPREAFRWQLSDASRTPCSCGHACAFDGDGLDRHALSGKFGNSFISLDHDGPALALKSASTPSSIGMVPAPAVQSGPTRRRRVRRDLHDARERVLSSCTSITWSAPKFLCDLRRAAS